jgi:catechol 2,3-dioxygenase-like lactoylglutathione lyase family enzyme
VSLHHVELWVPDLAGSTGPWSWLLGELGWTPFQDWPAGRSWRYGDTYLVLEQSPALSGGVHDRLAPGLNHLAFTVAGRAEVDRLAATAPEHGWALMFADRHPHAGGPESYGAYLEDAWGYEVELAAGPP